MLHDDVGQKFGRHADFLRSIKPRDDAGDRDARAAGRDLLALPDGYDGGETAFMEVGLRCRGRKGDALLVLNVDRNGEPDRFALHAGRPIQRGEKWLLSQWIRSRPINAFPTPGVAAAPLPGEWARLA